MPGLSNYAENKVIDHTLGTTAYTKPTNIYVALFTTDPAETGAGTEVSGNGYVRKVATFNAAANGSATNSAEVLFDVATASWGTLTHVGLFDAVSAGNMIWSGALSTSKAIASTDQFRLPAGNITVTLD
jgi:hypothetical protein